MTDPTEGPEVTVDDERLLGALARLVRERDPVPPDLVAMAAESFTWRNVDAELAELVADSHADQGAALVRSATGSVRLLSFATGGLRLDLEVLTEGDARSLVGELDPGAPARIAVEFPGGTRTQDADELGRFVVTGLPAGMVRVRCEPASGPALLTPWLRI